MTISTNDACEGWHCQLNSKVRRHNLPFYQLITVMHPEATMIDIQAEFIADDKIRWNQHNKMRSDQGRVTTAWDAFKDGDTTPKQILRPVSSIYTLCVNI